MTIDIEITERIKKLRDRINNDISEIMSILLNIDYAWIANISAFRHDLEKEINYSIEWLLAD